MPAAARNSTTATHSGSPLCSVPGKSGCDAGADRRERPQDRDRLIEEASYHPGEWNGGCASYINAYIVNGGVVVPSYDSPRDQAALDPWQRIDPERETVEVQINDIAIGGGGVHCITQQQPATRVETRASG